MKSSKFMVAEQHLALQQAVAQILAESPTRSEATSRLLKTLGERLGWPLGALWLVDDAAKVLRCADTWHATATEAGEFEADSRGRVFAPGEGLPGSVWRGSAPVWIPDMNADATVPGDSVTVKLGFRAAFGFPISLGKKVLGVVELFNGQVRGPDETLLRVLGSLGRQIGLFLELKRTEEELAERARLETLRADVGEALTGSDSLATALQECAQALVRHLGVAFARIWMLDAEENMLELQASAGMYTHLDGGHSRVKVGQFKIGRIAQSRKPHLTNDVPHDPEVSDQDWARREGMVAFAGYPLIVAKRVVGVLAMFARQPLAEGAVHELKPLADEIALYIDRKDSEKAMRLRESALRAIAQGVFITDPARADEPLSYVNAAFELMTGYALREVKGRGIELLRGPETDAAAVEAVRAAYQDGREASVEVCFHRKDGQPFWTTLSVAPVTGSAGSVTHFVGVLTDISERKRFEEQLLEAKEAAEAANVAKSQFLANMSHELRTPLNAVIMYSELLQEESEDRGLADFVPDLEKIRLGGQHLLALVNGVLDLSKIEAGKMDLSLETFAVAKMVEEVVGTVQPLVAKKGNTLEVRCQAGMGEMHADLTKVRQILFNLLSNACKFTENGTITLEASRTEEAGRNWITLRVRDTGIGMSPEDVAKLFQPFTQAAASTSRKYGGTGLGLAISKRFCELMAGELAVGTKPGEGSTFTVRLPALVTAPTSEPSAAAPAVLGGGATILIIDDDAAVRDFMTRSLAVEGVRVVTAADGAEGLRQAAELHPALIFLDVLMPRMDGWAVLSALKADRGLADIPVVMLTITSQMEMGYVLGASEYLTKPIDRDRLLGLLQKYRCAGQAAEVLVVEDDEPTRQVIRRTLVKQGWTVAEAENGRVALERVAGCKPSVILLDLMMPGMDGFEFLGELRKTAAWQAIPVVVLTSKDLTADERRTLTGNVEKIIQKGAYGREALIREVRRVVALYAGNGPANGDQAPQAAAPPTTPQR